MSLHHFCQVQTCSLSKVHPEVGWGFGQIQLQAKRFVMYEKFENT